MPGFATHYLFGVSTVQKRKPSYINELIAHHHTVYGLGLQGPDIFFYYLPSFIKYKKNPGAAAHNSSTGRFLSYLMKSRHLFNKKDEYEIACCYILGFIGHYTLDTVCHPYIYGRTRYSEDDPTYYGRHVYLETDIDAFLLAQYKKMLPSEFYQDRTIHLNLKECHVVAKMLQYTYHAVFPEYRLRYRQLYDAIRFMETGVRTLHDPHGKKKTLLRYLERRICGYAYASPLIANDSLRFTKDPMNLTRRDWRNPWDRTCKNNDTFFDLIKKARAQYSDRITICEQLFAMDRRFHYKHDQHSNTNPSILFHDLLKDLGNCSYSSGLPLSQKILQSDLQ